MNEQQLRIELRIAESRIMNFGIDNPNGTQKQFEDTVNYAKYIKSLLDGEQHD